ncbi:Gfo/Idh/MocA family protein [Streptomyces sp. NPDC059850]|uniref:Gfo/Idh/MocA family protein n=1 Tax=Streptomyces sp. NPDC059850 TaxID=3346970 RepID=UPI00365F3967
MRPVRIGVLGCADIARRRMLPAMAAQEGVEIAAIASRDAARARELAGQYGVSPHQSYGDLLERDDVDAVYIPLPAALHAQWANAALRAGKHVLAEKPLTTSLAETEGLLALAAKSGLALMENVMFVHHSQHAAIRRLVADGAIGRLRAFHATFAIPGLPDGDIRYNAELGGGALWDTGVYPVRAALYFLGDALEVVGATLGAHGGRQVDTAGAALLRTPDGVSAQLSFGLDHGYRSAYELWGSLGRITVERAFTPPADHQPRVRIERQGSVEELALPADDQVAATVRAFAAAVRGESVPDPLSLRQAWLLDELRACAAKDSR